MTFRILGSKACDKRMNLEEDAWKKRKNSFQLVVGLGCFFGVAVLFPSNFLLNLSWASPNRHSLLKDICKGCLLQAGSAY